MEPFNFQLGIAHPLEVYYDAHLQELLAERLVARWQTVDEVTKVLVAVTASGSAVAGWVLWTQSAFHTVWSLLAGAAALLAIISAVLAVPSRVKDWVETRRLFAGLRVDLELLRERMRVNPQFDVATIQASYEGHKKRYGEGVHRLPNDAFVTRRLECAVQDDLNRRIADLLEHG